METLEKQLLELGLSKGEIKVYWALLKCGPSTIGPLVKESGVSSSKIYNILEKITKHGLANSIYKNKFKYFQAANINSLLQIIQEKTSKLDLLKKEIEKQAPIIENYLKTRSSEKTTIYRGYNGMKTAWLEAIKTIPPKGTYLFFAVGYEQYPLFERFFAQITHKLKEKHVNIKGIIPQKYRKLYTSFPHPITYTSFTLPADTTIAGKYLLILVWDKDQPVVYAIESSILLDSYKKFFQEIFNTKIVTSQKK